MLKWKMRMCSAVMVIFIFFGNSAVTMAAPVKASAQTEMKEEVSDSEDLKYLNSIKENYELAFNTVYKDFTFPAKTGDVDIKWESADSAIEITDGNQAVITRPAYGKGTKAVSVTATFYIGSQSVKKNFTVQVPETAWGYLLTYVVSVDPGMQEASAGSTDNCLTDTLHLALSKDGAVYTALNKEKAVLYTTNKRQMGSPVIFRKADGTYGVLASQNESDSTVILYDSEDLINFTNGRCVSTNSKGITVTEPEVWFDTEIGAYRLYWKDKSGQGYMTVTPDFKAFTEPEQTTYIKKAPAAGAALPEYAAETGVLELTREEYERVENKYGDIHNTGLEPTRDIKAALDTDVNLPEKVTARYNDGSAKEFPVKWATSGIDYSREGSYTVEGTIIQDTYHDPLTETRTDPHIIYNEDDEYYYFISSYPAMDEAEDTQNTGYDRLNIRRAGSINELTNAEEVTLFEDGQTAADGVTYYRCFRAPELHKIGGKWRIITSASTDSHDVMGEMTVFTCEDGDIMNPDSWDAEGVVEAAADGETPGAFDTTFFEAEGQCYYVTAKDGSIRITTFEADNVLKPTGSLVELGGEAFGWEMNLGSEQAVNEGPAVIRHNGKIYIAYSGSTVDQPYYAGMLYAEEKSDLMDPESWTKIPYPVLTNEDNSAAQSQYVSRNNSFFTDSDGNMNIIYHEKILGETNETVNSDGDLNDSGIYVYVKRIHFTADGTPVLNMTAQEELAEEFKTVSVHLELANTVTEKYTAETKTTEKDKTTGENKITEEDKISSRVTISNKMVTLGVKEKFTLRAEITPAEASQEIEWSSNMESVATVSSEGEITAVKAGTADITAKTAKGKTAVCKVTVKEAPKEISIEPVDIVLQNGNTIQLEMILPEDTASNKITYSTSDRLVAGVSSKGKITAKKKGKTTITAKTFNGKMAEVEITVK